MKVCIWKFQNFSRTAFLERATKLCKTSNSHLCVIWTHKHLFLPLNLLFCLCGCNVYKVQKYISKEKLRLFFWGMVDKSKCTVIRQYLYRHLFCNFLGKRTCNRALADCITGAWSPAAAVPGTHDWNTNPCGWKTKAESNFHLYFC